MPNQQINTPMKTADKSQLVLESCEVPEVLINKKKKSSN